MNDAPNQTAEPTHAPPVAPTKDHKRLATLSLAALGVVFGDIGTSPLYALRECFHGEYGIAVTSANILGVLSLIFWTLILVVTIKYLTFILRAHNNGEGGVIALTALVRAGKGNHSEKRWLLLLIGLFGASLLYGDGMITPAISVMSAIEGLRIVTPVLDPYVIPVTIFILACLFMFQHRGTAKIGALFGPIILVWFLILAIMGIFAIATHPQALVAVRPGYGLSFLIHNRLTGFLVLGAVFLVVTGVEALYADMGHFGAGPIRLVWLVIVLPALLLNYFGQGAILLQNPSFAHHPFYSMVPSWAVFPMVLMATTATIIASQAVITGAFSLTQQAVQMNYLPRLRIVHTSAQKIGQIYVPAINWLLMAATIGLVAGFRSSSKLAAAYGVAVTSTMVITTILFYVVARNKWGWGRWAAGIPAGLFLLVDLAFFGANVSKILHGAWFPLVIGLIVFVLMTTWKNGRLSLARQLRALTLTYKAFQESLQPEPPQRVTGQAVFLVGDPERMPSALINNIYHNRVLHTTNAILHFQTEEVPRVPNLEKVIVSKLGGGFWKVIVRQGFMETPGMPQVIELVREQGLEFSMDDTSFFIGHERLQEDGASGMWRWQAALFRYLSRNAFDVAAFYQIPTNQVIEVGVSLRL
jgi:KUP system potassium uptake protein